jgi:hypothetical protein
MKSMTAALLMSAVLPAVPLAADFPAERIVAMASGDWDKDGTQDLAIIATPEDESGDDNGLYIYLSKAPENRMTVALSLPNSVWGRFTLYGQEPVLTALPNGSLTLETRNESIGRDRWRQVLTIAYRNFDFIVAGYTYSSYDTVAEEGVENSTHACDLNILTGKGESDGRRVSAQPQFVLLKDWKDEIGRGICGLDN